MKNPTLKIQKFSSAKIITDCTQPANMIVYVNYVYPTYADWFGNQVRHTMIGDCGEFAIYENASNECVMVCHNATNNTIVYKRTRAENQMFPTFLDFACIMFNMGFSEVYGTYGVHNKSNITIISDEETVSRTLPYLTERFESFKKTKGVLLQTDLYTAVFNDFLYRHLVSDSRGRLYLDNTRVAETEDDINTLFKEYKLKTSSFLQFNTDGEDVDEEEPQQQIIPLNVPGEMESDNEDEKKTTEQLADEINELADDILAENKKKEEEEVEQTIQRLTSLPVDDDDILRFVIIVGDKLWSEPRYVRAKNFPTTICNELRTVVACLPLFEGGKFVIQAEKISVE